MNQYQYPYQYTNYNYANNPNYNPNIYIPRKKVYEPFEKKDNVFMFIFLCLMFIFVDFAICSGFGLGFTISYYLIFAFSTLYLWKKGEKKDLFSLACGALSCVGAVTFTLYCNDFMNAIMFVLIGGLFSLYCLGISASYTESRSNFKLLINLFLSTFIQPFENLGDIVGSIRAGAAKTKKQYGALFGVLLAIPVLTVVVPLLIESDAAFEALVKAIAKNIGKYLLELVGAALITPFVFSFMYGKKGKLNTKEHSALFAHKKIFPISGSVSFLSVISFTYFVYLFSQLAYFFSAFSGILPESYERSASDFARRGFYEMCAVCVINVMIVSIVSMFTKRNEGRVALSVKLLSLFISLFSVLLIVIAMQKMKLNITTYGVTRNRLLVSVFMIMILVIIAFFVLHIFAPKVSYMQPIILICSVMFIALSFADIDSITYKYNLKAYQNETIKTIDMYTISRLCPPEEYYVKIAKLNDAELSHKAVARMISEQFYTEEPYMDIDSDDYYIIKNGKIITPKKDFRYFNIAEWNARKSVVNYYNSLSPKEKAAFDDTYNKIKHGSYSFDEDSVYDNESSKIYSYNAETGKYDKTEENNYD